MPESAERDITRLCSKVRFAHKVLMKIEGDLSCPMILIFQGSQEIFRQQISDPKNRKMAISHLVKAMEDLCSGTLGIAPNLLANIALNLCDSRIESKLVPITQRFARRL